jgi:predicted nucleic-acid-binding Zn-ribbon protein
MSEMAQPNCAKCGNTGFSMSKIQVSLANFYYWAIHCSKCGAVVNFVEHINNASVLEKLAKKLDVPL